jgi:hypothetical protein
MSRLSRYRRGSLVPHLIALTLLLAGATLGVGGVGDEAPHGVLVAHAATPTSDGAGEAPEPRAPRLAGLDTTATPGSRTWLAPNRPNPFSESTTIDFSLASKMTVTLKVYDFWYSEVETLIDNVELEPGLHFARFVVGAGSTRPIAFTGMYFYELRAGDEIHQRRMLVIK